MYFSLFQSLILILIPLTTHARNAGILYEVWHTRAADAMRTVHDKGGVQLTTELVIQSNASLTLDDVYGPYGINADIYNVQPQLGFYCLYRARPGDVPNPPLRDCENITAVAFAHAQMLSEAGFDYVAVDVTNWPHFNYTTDRGGHTDVSVIRPTEVLLEEWATLRAQGHETPAITPWVCSPKNSSTWQYYLHYVYNNPKYQTLLYRRPGSDKLAFFIPATSDCMDADVRSQIESNGGRDNIETIPMWALFKPSTYAEGVWGFFSPCISTDGSYTTSMVGVGPCGQPETRDARGSVVEVTASGGYMVSQAALPFASPGHLRGLTLARLFERVLALGAADLFVSSFNEHIGGRQAPASQANIAFNMGLPTDPQRRSVWVDTYASEFSRDIEPTVEGGGRLWEVARACVRLYKENKTCAGLETTNPCCTRTDKEIFNNIWSLRSPQTNDLVMQVSAHRREYEIHRNSVTLDAKERAIRAEERSFDGSPSTAGSDPTASRSLEFILTSNATERALLITRGGYTELCSPIPNPSAFCVDSHIQDGRPGPFMVYNSADVGLPVVALHRCRDHITRARFVSTDPACEGGAHEAVLGFGARRPGLEMLRALRRCLVKDSLSLRTHALDLPCDVPDPSAPLILAYVR